MTRLRTKTRLTTGATESTLSSITSPWWMSRPPAARWCLIHLSHQRGRDVWPLWRKAELRPGPGRLGTWSAD
jgi:hypothetical protein